MAFSFGYDSPERWWQASPTFPAAFCQRQAGVEFMLVMDKIEA